MIWAAPAATFLLALAATPVVRRLAFLCGATDVPDARRVHSRPTARAGGVGVALAAAVGIVLGGAAGHLGPLVLGGAGLLLAVGMVDDVWSLRAETKLVAQAAAAVLAVAGGLRLACFGHAPALGPALLDGVLTGVWIVLITNAFNLTDGLDGLASGIGLISLVWLAGAAAHAGDVAAATAPLVLAAGLLGFLPYNFNPATIFLGDSGSLVIGYALAVLPLAGTAGPIMPPLAALFLVAVPATDTSLAIARRFLSRCLRAWGDGLFWEGLSDGVRNTARPDRRHVHHRLLDLGFTQRRAVLLLYMAATSTAALAYLVAGVPSWPVDLVALGIGVTVIWLVQALGFDELQPARSGLILPVLRRLARRRPLIVVVDLVLVVAAYGGSLALTGGRQMPAAAAAAAVALMAGTQLAAFSALGVYRTAWRSTGVAGFGMLLRACGAGTIAGYIALRLLGLPAGGDAAVVHFLLFLPAATLTRLSFVLLINAVRTNAPERALICGTASEALHALVRLRRNGTSGLHPIGFVEVLPRLQGRQVGHLPVLGTLDALPAIVVERQVRHLVLADPALGEAGFQWARAVCRQHGVRVHRYVEQLVDCDEALSVAEAPPLTIQAASNGNGHATTNGNGTHAATNGNGNGAAHAITNGNGIGHPASGHGRGWQPGRSDGSRS
ncbi:MAG: hypothetical protein E6J55_18885 [Deltaproteobacteria bacterium]|nr:MAG: hypothetical protein E6J55_18885 [Deltaproteobacteria bacterium]